MDDAEQLLADKLSAANNVLVTVSRNPNVDQLAALLGLSLILNKQGKHCAAVFSGAIPSTLEFLKPENTIERNTDSLRDFIIALDKNKADKLRYKVEDNIVRIFITPYKTSINQDDLEFSQGDFNVDVVIALGVSDQTDLDEAITAHGRILHDATVASINLTDKTDIGAINWNDASASSLCELVTNLTEYMDENILDEQIATALLTGIVSETDRFSNDKTSPRTMSASAILMSSGANQQLVATQLEDAIEGLRPTRKTLEKVEEEAKTSNPKNDGTLEIAHEEVKEPEKVPEQPKLEDELPKLELPKPDLTDNLPPLPAIPPQPVTASPNGDMGLTPGSKLITEPPTLGGTLTANTNQNDIDPVTDPMSMPSTDMPQLLNRKDNGALAPLGPDNTNNIQPPNLTLDALTAAVSNAPPLAPPQPFMSSPPAILSPPPVTAAPSPTALVPPANPTSSSDPLSSITQNTPLVGPPSTTPAPSLITGLTPPPPSWVPPSDDSNAIADLDKPSNDLNIDEDGNIKLPGQTALPNANIEADVARQEVNNALNTVTSNSPPPPIDALNAQPLGPELHPTGSDQSITGGDPPPVPPPIPFDFGQTQS